MPECTFRVHSVTTLPPSSSELRVVSDVLGLTSLNHTGPITWGSSCHFVFSSRVELLTRKAGGKMKVTLVPPTQRAFWVLRRFT